MKKSQRYWQQHNTRRPLPAMYEAYRQYGNKVYHMARHHKKEEEDEQ